MVFGFKHCCYVLDKVVNLNPILKDVLELKNLKNSQLKFYYVNGNSAEHYTFKTTNQKRGKAN